MSAIPVLRTWVDEDLATAQMLNDNVRAPSEFILTGLPFCHVSDTANQSINNNTWTVATWNSAVSDTSDNMHPGSGGTITIVRAGLYTIHGTALFATSDIGMRGIRFKKNGTIFVESTAVASYADTGGTDPEGQGSIETAVNASDPGISCSVNDTLTMEVFQTSGGALNLLRNYSTNIYSWFSVRWVATS